LPLDVLQAKKHHDLQTSFSWPAHHLCFVAAKLRLSRLDELVRN